MLLQSHMLLEQFQGKSNFKSTLRNQRRPEYHHQPPTLNQFDIQVAEHCYKQSGLIGLKKVNNKSIRSLLPKINYIE